MYEQVEEKMHTCKNKIEMLGKQDVQLCINIQWII